MTLARSEQFLDAFEAVGRFREAAKARDIGALSALVRGGNGAQPGAQRDGPQRFWQGFGAALGVIEVPAGDGVGAAPTDGPLVDLAGDDAANGAFAIDHDRFE